MLSTFSKAASAFFYASDNKIVCDTVGPLAAPFDAASYMGTWYNI